MSGLTLTLKRAPAQVVDLSALTPDQLAGKSSDDILRSELLVGNRRQQVGDLFDIHRSDAQPDITIRASTSRLAYIGARMQTGTITVHGDCGPYVGAGMRGGRIVVDGAAGAFTGCGMRAGTIELRGDAGDFVGGALPGDKQGMRGGAILIGGSAGDRAGDCMRRGIILIAGNAGAYCGSRMLAGTIVVSGQVGASPGFGLKRGTLLLRQAPAEMPATFQDAGEHRLLFLTVLAKSFEREGGAFGAFLPITNHVRRYSGDLATGGKGEMLLPCRG
jgi:formylmethanofuran dehydrogenase subunit C